MDCLQFLGAGLGGAKVGFVKESLVETLSHQSVGGGIGHDVFGKMGGLVDGQAQVGGMTGRTSPGQ